MYHLFVEETVFDYLIVKLSATKIHPSKLLSEHLLFTTDTFSDVGIYNEVKQLLKSIGYKGNFTILKSLANGIVI